MKRVRIWWLFVMVFLVGQEDARSCLIPPDPFFAPPSYIDPDYKVPSYTEMWYGRRTKVNMIFQQFMSPESGWGLVDDSEARARSEQEEATHYSAYEDAARLFRDEDYQEAVKIFTGLRDSIHLKAGWPGSLFGKKSTSWVREASTYMIARCQLRMAQQFWHGYGEPAHYVVQAQVYAADSAYQRYLQEYPDGLYAQSAKDLRRRVYLMTGQRDQLNSELRRAMNAAFPLNRALAPPDEVQLRVVDEFLNCFQGKVDFATDVPILTTLAWLGKDVPLPDDLELLDSREQDFASYPGLFRFVRALGLYRLERYEELLQKTPEVQPEKNVLWLSTQMLRARSLVKLGYDSAALAALVQMHDVSPEDAVELEMAIVTLNEGNGLWLFDTTSPVIKAKNLKAVATYGLSDQDLETGITKGDVLPKERQILVDELARRYLLSGCYSQFTKLLESENVPVFDSAKAIASALAKDTRNVDAIVDLGEFLYEQSIDPDGVVSRSPWHWQGPTIMDMAPRCLPCTSYAQRLKTYNSPMVLFRYASHLVQQSGRKSDSEARALHYVVLGGRSLSSNQMRILWHTSSSNDTTFAICKAAFRRLHRVYKDSKWAQMTPYYYR